MDNKQEGGIRMIITKRRTKRHIGNQTHEEEEHSRRTKRKGINQREGKNRGTHTNYHNQH